MIAQFDHLLLTSFKEWLEFKLLNQAQAYYNITSGDLFKINDPSFAGYDIYTAPFHQWVYDSSVSGSVIPSGFYDGSTFISIGTGINDAHLDFNFGRAIIPSGIATGNSLVVDYSLKEFNTYLTSKSDYDLVAETNYLTAPILLDPISGLSPDTVVLPAIFIKQFRTENKPWALGGMDATTSIIRCIAMGNNDYQLIGIASLLRDAGDQIFPLFTETPFNEFGDLKNGQWNYATIIANTLQYEYAFIQSCVVSRVENEFIKQHHPSLNVLAIEFEIIKPRTPRI